MANKKSRILHILRLLYEKTDEQNPLCSTEIIGYLAGLGINVHRTTIAADAQLLVEAGFDVVTVRSSPNKYFIGNRQFELPELKLLVDAVESSKFITSKKSTQLVQKIMLLISAHQAEELSRQICIGRRIKPNNEMIYYTVDVIQQAMHENKKIKFRYFEYAPNKERVLKNDGYRYEFSPYALFWNEDHYYIIGYSDKHKKIIKFRVDRIEKAEITPKQAIPKPSGFDSAVYANQIFEMYDGKTKMVELKCANELMKVIIDRFGEDVETEIIDDEHFKIKATVSVSPTFFGWVFGFVGKMSIISPTDAIEQYKFLAKTALSETL